MTRARPACAASRVLDPRPVRLGSRRPTPTRGPVYVARRARALLHDVPRRPARPVVDISGSSWPRGAVTTVRADAERRERHGARARRPAARLRAGLDDAPRAIAPRRPRAPAQRETWSTRRRPAAELAQRRRRQERRHDLVHRPELRPSAGLPARARARRRTSTATTRARGDLAVVADGFDKPNGLAFSPDETTLYVGDSGAPPRARQGVRRPSTAAALASDARASPIATPASRTGSKVDADGPRLRLVRARRRTSSARTGEPLGEIAAPRRRELRLRRPRRATCCSSPPTTRSGPFTATPPPARGA